VFCGACWPKVFEDRAGELACEVQGCDASYADRDHLHQHLTRAHGYEPDELP
jgi:hypothetical protein